MKIINKFIFLQTNLNEKIDDKDDVPTVDAGIKVSNMIVNFI